MNALLIALLLAVQQPGDVGARITAATSLVDAGKLDEGIAALKQVIADHPENETAKYELALAYMGKGDAESCRATLEPLADTARANRVLIFSVLGSCLDELGQRDKAIAMYRRGLKLEPTHSGLNFNLAVTLARQNKFDEARELLKADTHANPWHASAHLVLATIFEQQNFRVPAIASYLRFLALDSSPRAKDAAVHLHYLLAFGVKPTKEGANVTFDTNSRKEEGDYSAMEMMLALTAASNVRPEKKQSEFEAARAHVATTVAYFAEADARDDYTAAVNQPFFVALQSAKLTDTFAALSVAPLKLDGTDSWMKAHEAEISRYLKWIAPQRSLPVVQAPKKN